MTTSIETRLQPEFARFNTARPVSPWLSEVRRTGFEHFTQAGLPTRKHEAWRYTDLSKAVRQDFSIAADASLAPDSLAELLAARIPSEHHAVVFVNGQLKHCPKLEQRGVVVSSLRQAIVEAHPLVQKHLGQLALTEKRSLTALNAAFLDDGVLLVVDAQARCDVPLHVVFVSTGNQATAEQATMIHPRLLCLMGESSEAMLLQTHLTLGKGHVLSNAVAEVRVEKQARLSHTMLVDESSDASHLSFVKVQVASGGSYVSNAMTLGGRLVRTDIEVALNDKDASCTLNGLYIASDGEHCDYHTTIEHNAPHTQSREFYKGIVAEGSTAVFNGRVVVQPAALKTDAAQSNKNLLLHKSAQVNTKPELEIYADDVKCAHGATVGQLDEKAVFYLRSRGIDVEEARRKLTYAFAAEVVTAMSLGTYHASVEEAVKRKLARC